MTVKKMSYRCLNPKCQMAYAETVTKGDMTAIKVRVATGESDGKVTFGWRPGRIGSDRFHLLEPMFSDHGPDPTNPRNLVASCGCGHHFLTVVDGAIHQPVIEDSKEEDTWVIKRNVILTWPTQMTSRSWRPPNTDREDSSS